MIAAVVDLAQSSMPTVDSRLNNNASTLLNPNLIQYGENKLIKPVSSQVDMIKKTLSTLEY
ncbi:MAG: hypothetical protein ACKPKO_04275, partial [Candidatus Fonsibacter sp.]